MAPTPVLGPAGPAPLVASHPAVAPRAAEPRGLVRYLDEPAWKWVRLGTDVLMLALAVAAAILGSGAAGVAAGDKGLLIVFPLLVVALFASRGGYRPRLRTVTLEILPSAFGAISIAVMLLVSWVAIAGNGSPPAALLARLWLFGLLFVAFGQLALARTQGYARRQGLLSRPALIVGAGVVGEKAVRRLEEHPEYGMSPVGFLDADPPDRPDRPLPLLGGPQDLPAAAQATGARHVVLAFSAAPDRGLVPLVRRCNELGLHVWLVPRLFESINERVAMEHLGGMPLLGLNTVDPKGLEFTVKHMLDRVFAAVVLVVLSPLLLLITLAVKIDSPGPALFRQRRVGRDGRVFDLLKFRSMRPGAQPELDERDERPAFDPGEGLGPGGVEGEDRRTRLGRWLRRTSLDELPQFINVLRGQMSVVGPRPERPEYVERFQELDRYADRHRVKSGITGWAQVNGLRGRTSISDRVEWDNYYIENWSLWLDVRIVAMTVAALFQAPPHES